MKKIFAKLTEISAFFLVLWSFFENMFLLSVRHEMLGGNVKVVHISDVHKKKFGMDNVGLCRKIQKEQPDIIIISGDLVSRTETKFKCIEKMLDRLCRIAPVYMIFGNHEQSLPKDMQEKFLKSVARTNAVLLRNQSAVISVKGRNFRIYGLLESYDTYRKNGGYRGLEKLETADICQLLGKCSDEEVILIAHNPLFGETYSRWGAEYTFSGHVHGGAARIFGIGIFSPERKLFPKYSKGVYNIGGMKLLVSAGLGKLRLFNPPEIVVYYI